MHRPFLLTMMALLLAPSSAAAIQLHWSSGTTNVNFTTARQCTLLVQAESGQILPDDWRLVWVAGNDSLKSPLVFHSQPAESGDPAAACELVALADPASTAANTIGARFCHADPSGGTSARLIVDAPVGARAKLIVVAFAPLPGDSMQGTTLRSGEITLNGGCGGPYPPTIFRASSTHHLGQLSVSLVGANLTEVNSVPISATDSSWTYALAITSKSDAAITAGAALAAPLPEFVVAAEGADACAGAAAAPADNFPPLDPQSCFSSFSGSQDTTGMQPKDFAFIDAGDQWHIFYTRQYLTTNYSDRTNTRAIGHATSTDQHLSSWTVVSRSALHVRDGRIWDNLHVWAPSIVRQGITYYMFYTGVQLDTVQRPPLPLITSEIQRIGVATSMDLNNWTQDATHLFSNKKVPWTFQDSTAHSNNGDGWQFRDPFVMADPESPGKWLMYYVTLDSLDVPARNQYVVGVGHTPGSDLRVWQDLRPLLRTSQSHMRADRDESPHAFFRHGKWWLMYTSNHFWGDQTTYSLNAGSPASSDTSSWSRPDSLKAITCGEHGFPTSLNQWHATEYVGIGSHEYLSAFSDALAGGGIIQFTQIQAPDGTCPTDSLRLDCPDVWTAVEQGAPVPGMELVRFTLADACPAHSSASLRLVLRARMQVQIAIYDVSGRRVKTLVDGTLPAGSSALSWDGHAEQGHAASSGVYFARVTYGGGRRVVRIPFLR